MRRRKILATLAGTSTAATAGCIGILGDGGDGGDGNDGGDGGNSNTDSGNGDGGGGSDGNSESSETSEQSTTEQSFQLGDPIWSHRNGGNAARSSSVTVEGLTSSNPTEYTIPSAASLLTQNAIVANNKIRDITDGSVVETIPATNGTPIALHDGTFVVTTSEGEIKAIDAQSLEEQWSYLPKGEAISGVAAGGLFFYSFSLTVGALDMANGEQVWEREGGQIYGFVNDRLFIKDAARDLAINTEDGSIAYEVGNKIRGLGPDGSVYAGILKRFNAEDGSEVWNVNGIDEVFAADDEYVYGRQRGLGGNFVVLRASNGEEVFTKDIAPASVVVGANRVYLGADDRVFAFSKDSGEEQARYAVGSGTLSVGPQLLVAKGPYESDATVLVDR